MSKPRRYGKDLRRADTRGGFTLIESPFGIVVTRSSSWPLSEDRAELQLLAATASHSGGWIYDHFPNPYHRSESMRTGKERIEISEGGFSIFNGRKHLGDVAWNNIKKVVALKRDLFTVDAVCLRILTYEPDQFWELDDDVAGFWDLSARLKSELPGYEQNWEEHVVKPAFKENLRFVFERPLKPE